MLTSSCARLSARCRRNTSSSLSSIRRIRGEELFMQKKEVDLERELENTSAVHPAWNVAAIQRIGRPPIRRVRFPPCSHDSFVGISPMPRQNRRPPPNSSPSDVCHVLRDKHAERVNRSESTREDGSSASGNGPKVIPRIWAGCLSRI